MFRFRLFLSALALVSIMFMVNNASSLTSGSSSTSGPADGVVITTVYLPDDCLSPEKIIAKNGDNLLMHYAGFIDESSESGIRGKLFDSSRKRARGRPLKFTLGAGMVIKGWEEGVIGMCLGERRQLVVPPKLAYGARGAGSSVPPGATLRFEIEAVGINNHKLPSAAPTPLPNVFAQMDLNPMDGRISWDEMERWYQQEHPERLSTIPRGVFEMQDKNGDQYITWQEFNGPKGDSPSQLHAFPDSQQVQEL